MKKDPVVYAMKYIIKSYNKWSDRFYSVLKIALKQALSSEYLNMKEFDASKKVSYTEYKKAILAAPYILIRFISSFFLENDEDIINSDHKLGSNEYQKLLEIGETLELDKIPIFQMFCNTFK